MITFTRNGYHRTVFINKLLNQGLWGCLFYFVSQVLCICTNDGSYFSMRNIFFSFYLIIWWGVGIASESKLEVLKDGWFGYHNCFYYFLLFCLTILFYYYSNIPYRDNKSWIGIGIHTNSRVCSEINTHTGTLDYFINDKHIKVHVVSVSKDVYFGVWYFICYLILFVWKYYKLKWLTIIINYFNDYFYFF
jgi:hypothetical protein